MSWLMVRDSTRLDFFYSILFKKRKKGSMKGRKFENKKPIYPFIPVHTRSLTQRLTLNFFWIESSRVESSRVDKEKNQDKSRSQSLTLLTRQDKTRQDKKKKKKIKERQGLTLRFVDQKFFLFFFFLMMVIIEIPIPHRNSS
jgi:hypothetical protein